LRQAGFDTCSTASNHTLDAGEQGVYRTLDVLDAAGLRHAGSHRSAAEQRTPTILDVRGVRVAHLSYTFGLNGLSRPAGRPWVANLLDPAAVLAEARRARSAGADIVVASLHWGIEYDHRAGPEQVALARRLLRPGGVDLILGSHAHVVQPLEKVGDGWVAYGMGNHLARQSMRYPDRREGVMPRFTFTEQAPGRWVVTRVAAVATWVELAPQIRVVSLPAALADPATAPARRQAYLATQHRITGYLQARGARLDP
ncbi:MAG TPA: CapA family protein, partial [Micromonosporaceae bacterium]|nr:CapA family protein [Micromonosporaceae bacterium]